jgi:AraC family transcriptional regulator, arabinose operon regulatory protein
MPTATEADPDVLMVGTNHWEPRPWYRLRSPGTWLLTYTTSGSGEYRVGRTQLATVPGDLVLVHRDADVERRIPGPARWQWHYVHFDPWPGWELPPAFARIATGLYRAHVGLLTTRQRIEDAFRRLIADVRARDAAEALTGLRRKGAKVDRGAIESRQKLALGANTEILLLVSGDAHEAARLDPRIVAALQIVTGDLSAHHEAGALARTTGLSTSRFMHLFREQLGVPLRRAIRTLRLQQAALRLAYGSEPIGTIAEEVGFSSIYTFSGEFHRAYGVSPRKYRDESRTLELPPHRARVTPRRTR